MLQAYIQTILLAGAVIAGGTPVEHKRIATIDAYLSECHIRGLFNGSALVAHRDEVLFSKGYGYADRENQVPNTPDTIFRIGSITKQFTVVMIFQLVEEGRIRLEGKLTEYLPEYRPDTGNRVTIDHLLRHTSGITSYTNIPGFWENEIVKHQDHDDFIDRFHSGDLIFEPGARYAYNNTGYFLLGEIIERMTGKSYADNLTERITETLEMNRTGVDRGEISPEKKARGYIREGGRYVPEPYCYMPLISGCGDMYSTVEDLFKWNLALSTEHLLNPGSRALMFKPYGNRFEGHAYSWDHRRMLLKRSRKRLSLAAFNGSLFGFMTDGIRVEEGEYFIALFNNTGQFDAWAISHALINILYGEEPMFPVRRDQ